jgi:uncharacterized protein YneF (UPF0154 family)
MFDFKNIERQLIDAKKKDLEYSTHDFTQLKSDIENKNYFKPYTSIFIAAFCSISKIAIGKINALWMLLTSLSIIFSARGLYFLIKMSLLNKKLANNAEINKYNLKLLKEKASFNNNQDLLAVVNKIENNPTDIEVNALSEYVEEKQWV